MLANIKRLFALLVIAGLGYLLMCLITQPSQSKPTKSSLPQQTEQSSQQQTWFAPRQWLSDAEIDWAVTQMPQQEQVKVWPAWQFHCVRELQQSGAETSREVQELLAELNDESKKLIFMPVNQPNFHWSLLVYEVKTKVFYHYDTLRGANWAYTKPLVEELLQFLLADWQDSSHHLQTRHHISQGNSWDCGVAVISLIKRIQERYQGDLATIELGKFDFGEERNYYRNLYLKELE